MSKWKCKSCNIDLETKGAYVSHMKSRMIPVNPDTIEEDIDKEIIASEKRRIYVKRNGILVLGNEGEVE